jgi:hypothetical protein
MHDLDDVHETPLSCGETLPAGAVASESVHLFPFQETAKAT